MGKFEIKYLQRKVRAGREFFYFRVVRPGEKEFRRPLPHPTDDTFRQEYNAAWKSCFGALPDALLPEHCVERMVTLHLESEKFARLSDATKGIRRRVGAHLTKLWGEFDAKDIQPIHCQAVYDKQSDRPATAKSKMQTRRPQSLHGASRVASYPKTRGGSWSASRAVKAMNRGRWAN